jgi:hypothetical protein
MVLPARVMNSPRLNVILHLEILLQMKFAVHEEVKQVLLRLNYFQLKSLKAAVWHWSVVFLRYQSLFDYLIQMMKPSILRNLVKKRKMKRLNWRK